MNKSDIEQELEHKTEVTGIQLFYCPSTKTLTMNPSQLFQLSETFFQLSFVILILSFLWHAPRYRQIASHMIER